MATIHSTPVAVHILNDGSRMSNAARELAAAIAMEERDTRGAIALDRIQTVSWDYGCLCQERELLVLVERAVQALSQFGDDCRKVVILAHTQAAPDRYQGGEGGARVGRSRFAVSSARSATSRLCNSVSEEIGEGATDGDPGRLIKPSASKFKTVEADHPYLKTVGPGVIVEVLSPMAGSSTPAQNKRARDDSEDCEERGRAEKVRKLSPAISSRSSAVWHPAPIPTGLEGEWFPVVMSKPQVADPVIVPGCPTMIRYGESIWGRQALPWHDPANFASSPEVEISSPAEVESTPEPQAHEPTPEIESVSPPPPSDVEELEGLAGEDQSQQPMSPPSLQDSVGATSSSSGVSTPVELAPQAALVVAYEPEAALTEFDDPAPSLWDPTLFPTPEDN
ncbi:hypothetical protein K474DRAFT_1777152 [Panus rudis PR-1116 ss-1]|nr:hypothetical protein K474DRAFT_1777152 [Panus rudis PR-1116 ss-1]